MRGGAPAEGGPTPAPEQAPPAGGADAAEGPQTPTGDAGPVQHGELPDALADIVGRNLDMAKDCIEDDDHNEQEPGGSQPAPRDASHRSLRGEGAGHCHDPVGRLPAA